MEPCLKKKDKTCRDGNRGYDRNARESSAERRAKIASWQAEKDAGDGHR